MYGIEGSGLPGVLKEGRASLRGPSGLWLVCLATLYSKGLEIISKIALPYRKHPSTSRMRP